MRKWMVGLGLGLFLVLDVLLVVLAWRHTYPDASQAAPAPLDVAGSDPSQAPSSSPSATPPAPDERFLSSYVEEGSLVRVPRSTSACRPEATVEVSVSADLGATFTMARAPRLTSVRSLTAPEAGLFVLSGTDTDCAAIFLTSSDGGLTWEGGSETPEQWSLFAGRVASPAGIFDAPCNANSMSVIDDAVARVACASGEVRGTSSGGAEWVTLGNLPAEVVAAAYTSPAEGYVLGSTGACSAMVFATADGGTTWREAHCAEGVPRGLAADGDTVVAFVDSGTLVSTDGGDTWSPRARG